MASKRGKYGKTDIKLQQLVSLLEGVTFKKISELSIALGPQTDRQTRRLIDQLTALGYPVEKEGGRSDARRIYNKQKNTLPLFSFEEMMRVMDCLNKAKAEKPLQAKLAQLVSARIENRFPCYEVYSVIQDAIQKGRKVSIKSYQPAGKPARKMTCTIGHADLEQAKAFAWDEVKSRYYTLNLEKMKGVEISPEKATPHPAWTDIKEVTDLFGFTPTGKEYHVSLFLTELAASLLVRQFPNAKAHLSVIKKRNYTWSFEATVFAIEPIARFVVGLLSDISVCGDENTKTGIQNYLKRIVEHNTRN